MYCNIDGDILIYRCAFAAEHTTYTLVDNESGVVIGQYESAADMKSAVSKDALTDFTVEKARDAEPVEHVLANLKSVMNRILSADKWTGYRVFLSKGNCFRHGIATMLEYKGHRKDVPRPVHYAAAREYLQKQYDTWVYESIEADDALAMMQDDKSVIVSIDKDLLQVPGLHFNWVKGEKYRVTPEVGLRKLYQQVLSGDATDNIPGIRGIGYARARRALAGIEPTKRALSAVCTRLWTDYLQSDAEKPVALEATEDGRWKYTGWNGIEHVSAAEEFPAEVYNLVEVGGRNAQRALEDSGESLPPPG